MRIVLSIVLTLLFAVAFVVFFLTTSIVRYVAEEDALVETAREADLRGTLVDVATEHIVHEVLAGTGLDSMSRARLRAALETVVTEDWLERNLRAVHRAAKSRLEDPESPTVIDLGPTKRALAAAVKDLEEEAREKCRDYFDAGTCADSVAVEAMTVSFRDKALRTIRRMPDRFDLFENLPSHDRQRARKVAEELSEVLGVARAARWVGLALLILLMAGIVLLASGSSGRVLRASGAALLVAAALYLLTAGIFGGVFRSQVEAELSRERQRHATLTPVQEAVAEGSQRFSFQLIGDATGRSTVPVTVCGVGGLVLLGVGVAFGNRD